MTLIFLCWHLAVVSALSTSSSGEVALRLAKVDSLNLQRFNSYNFKLSYILLHSAYSSSCVSATSFFFVTFSSLTIRLASRTTKRLAVDTEDTYYPAAKRVKKAPSTTAITQNPPSKKVPYTSSQTESLLKRVNNLRLDQFASQHRVPSSLAYFTAKDGHEYEVQLSSSDHIGATLLEQLCDLVAETSAKDYENSSWGWHYYEKKEEMRLPDMKFLLPYEKQVEEEKGSDGEDGGAAPAPSLAGFCSFMLCQEMRLPVIYIYEIHLFNREGCRGNGVGNKLMKLVETIGRSAGVVKCMLTVFTTNLRAEGFYRSLGYSEDQISPRARVLKSGKVNKPEYFILSKDLLPHDMEDENGTEKEWDKDTGMNLGVHEVVQMDTEKGREEEDVVLHIYDSRDELGRSDSADKFNASVG